MDNIFINPTVKSLVEACIDKIEEDNNELYLWGKHVRNKAGGKIRLLGRIATPIFTKIKEKDGEPDFFRVSPVDLLVWMSIMGFGTAKLTKKVETAQLQLYKNKEIK